MDELSERARAYLDAFAERHRAPAVAPQMRSQPKAAASLRWILPLVGIAAVAVASWRASRATAIEIADAKQFEAAPHRVERTAAEQAMQPQLAARAPVRLPKISRAAAPMVAATEPPRVRAPVRDAGPSSLRRELVLLDAAKASLRAGDRDAARRSLTRHADEFPSGLLAPERGRLTKRIDDETESVGCVHSSCVGNDDHQESTR
jgi:hypothetical protein